MKCLYSFEKDTFVQRLILKKVN